MGGVAGHAGVFAPATDVARFAECMLRGGTPLFQPATVRLFTRREETPAGTSRALGWDTPSPTESSSGACFSQASFGHLGFTGTSLWIDPVRQLSVTLLTNRTWPNRASQAIRQVRPLVHDAIVEALEETMKHKPATDTAKLGTERRNPATQNLDRQSALEIARIINAEDAKVAPRRQESPAANCAGHRRHRRCTRQRRPAHLCRAPAPVDASAHSMPPNVHRPSTPIRKPCSS